MDGTKTSLERAFELAASGDCDNVAMVVSKLNREGFTGSQVFGRTLTRQLAGLIKKARAHQSRSGAGD